MITNGLSSKKYVRPHLTSVRKEKIMSVRLCMSLVACLILAWFLSFSPALAAPPSGLTAVVNGVTLIDSNGDGVIPLSTSTNYGCLAVESSGTPRIVGEDSGDKLWLENVRFKTASGFATCTATVSFWANYAAPPDASANRKYERKGKGSLMRGVLAAPYPAYVKVEGWLDGWSVGGWEQKQPGGSFDLWKEWTYAAGTFGDPREIKFTFTVDLRSTNDRLKIEGADQFYVQNVALGGGGTPSDPTVTYGFGPDAMDNQDCIRCCRACPDEDENSHDGKGDKKDTHKKRGGGE